MFVFSGMSTVIYRGTQREIQTLLANQGKNFQYYGKIALLSEVKTKSILVSENIAKFISDAFLYIVNCYILVMMHFSSKSVLSQRYLKATSL